MQDIKSNIPFILEGNTVILEEFSPRFFPYAVSWRNDKNLSKYLNQPFELTLEIEKKWYEDIYLKDDTQCLMIVIDKKTNTPIGMHGWVDMDIQKKQCVEGRMVLGDRNFQGANSFLESLFIIGDYLYNYVDTVYMHALKENKSAFRLVKMVGFEVNKGKIQYPKYTDFKDQKQTELYRSKEMFLNARKEIFEHFQNRLFT